MGADTRLYVIDTSSIIEPRRLLANEKRSVQARVYAALGNLVDTGELMFPVQVYEELHRYRDVGGADIDRPFVWAQTHKDTAMGDVPLETLFESVRRVQATVDNLVDFTKTSPGDDADPYVVGLALHFKKAGFSVTVITEDRRDQASKTSIQSACAMLELPAFGIQAFLRLKGIWPKTLPT